MMTIIILALLLCVGCSQNHNYIIEGTTSQDGYYYLFTESELVDSAAIVDGAYRFEGVVDAKNPMRTIASTRLTNPMDYTRISSLILESGTIEVAEVNNEIVGGLQVSGTPANDAILEFTIEALELQRELDSSVGEQRRVVMQQYNNLVERTIKRNRDNFASVVMLMAGRSRYSDDQFMEQIDRLSQDMRNTDAVQLMISEINQ